MNDRPRFVVDASVAVKWHLDDEEFADQALALLVEYRDGRVELLAPDHIRFEVPNAIRVATRANRLTFQDGRTAITQFLSFGIFTTAPDKLVLAAYELSERFACSFYDGLYLALAEDAACPLVYADKGLRKRIEDRFPLALWIGDYSPNQA